MTRLVAFTFLVLLPIALSAPAESESDPAKSEKKGRSLGVLGMDRVASGAIAGQYGQNTGASETHDKKNFGLNYSSDRGSSNQFSNTNAAVGAAGGIAQGGVGYPYLYNHPQYLNPAYYPGASIYPHYYPQYLQYPVVGSGVSLPGVNAGAVAGVNAGVVPNVGYPRVVY